MAISYNRYADVVGRKQIKSFSNKTVGLKRLKAIKVEFDEMSTITSRANSTPKATIRIKSKGTKIEIAEDGKLKQRKLYRCGNLLLVALKGVWHMVESNSWGKPIAGKPVHAYDGRPTVVAV